MNVRAGIVGGDVSGWELLLRQEGIPHSEAGEGSWDDSFSVVVVGGAPSAETAARVKEYLRRGGAVLCSASAFARFGGMPPKVTPIKYLISGPEWPFSAIGVVDVYASCLVPAGANTLLTEKGAPAAYGGEWAGGWTMVLPFDPSAFALDRRTATKSFHARRRRLPFEHVALVSPSSIRRLVSASLEFLHHRRGLPYAHLWYYPDADASVFTFRVDTDLASPSDIETLHDLIRRNNVPATWFVDAKSQENDLDLFKKMGDDEIGIHCYEHAVYEDTERNLQNIGRALELFRLHDLPASSYAAPYGRWNDSLARAIAACGFEYSSEFSYDYDGLPSMERGDGEARGCLQVPIHPICIGSLRRQGFGDAEMKDYFRAQIARSMSAREPLMFYHHPRDGHDDVLAELFAAVRSTGLLGRRMIDVARWWKRRDSVLNRLEIHGAEVVLPGDAPDVRIRVTKDDGTELFVGSADAGGWAGMPWNPRPRPLPLPGDIRRIRRFNPWIPLIRLEDRIFGSLRA